MRALASLLFAVAVVLSHAVHANAQCVAGSDDGCARGDLEDPSGSFRLDFDRYGLQGWALAQFPVSDDIALAGNIYGVATGGAPLQSAPSDPGWRPYSRVDMGAIFRLGVVELFPKIGFATNFGVTDEAVLVPQLFAIVRGGPVHVETWNQFFLSSVFHAGRQDVFYTRNQILLSPWNVLGFGFQIEATVGISHNPGDALLSLPIGGTLQLQPTRSDVIQVFIAGETQNNVITPQGVGFVARSGSGLTGRLTYVRTF